MSNIKVNDITYEVEADPSTPLLWILRDELKLTGTKFSCGLGQCGACTVHLDGQPVKSCITPLQSVQDKAVTTIEGLNGEVAEAVQTAWESIDVPQCGYCQSGQVMSAVSLLQSKKIPTDSDINQAMSGNICRCATYQGIRAAVRSAAESLSEG